MITLRSVYQKLKFSVNSFFNIFKRDKVDLFVAGEEPTISFGTRMKIGLLYVKLFLMSATVIIIGVIAPWSLFMACPYEALAFVGTAVCLPFLIDIAVHVILKFRRTILNLKAEYQFIGTPITVQ